MTKQYILDPTIDYYSKCRSIAAAMTHMQRVKWAVLCAESVLSIYEKNYPNDNRPRAAIDAARTWMNNPSEENRLAAVYAAYAAAYAAGAAAAADAAYAAANAAAYAEQKDLCLKYARDILFKKQLRLRRKQIKKGEL
jgi:hypothetical protein